MKKEVFYFEKREWKIIWHFPPLGDGFYKIEPVSKTRSYSQNRLYWGYILTFIVQTYKDYWYIHTKTEIHEIFKKALIPRKRVKSDFSKKFLYILWSTTELNTKQFSQFIEMIKALFEFWEMEKLWLEKIESFVIPDIDNDELLYWESIIC